VLFEMSSDMKRWGFLLVTAAALTLAGGAAGCAADAEEPTEASEDALRTFPIHPGGGNRYDGLEGVRDEKLRAALNALVKDHQSLGYNRARVAIFKTGLTGTPKLECIYTGRLTEPDGSLAPGGFNTEHSWPQSRGANREPARSDLHHLFPVDAQMNSTRGNFLFGEVTCLHGGDDRCNVEKGGSALGRTEDGDLAFEVRKEKRGDIARAQFYFAVRYKLAIPPSTEATLKAWHHEDAPDAEETLRNDKIEEQQNNRNPFIDRPEFVDAISDF
jgi:deoxyribonuclease I